MASSGPEPIDRQNYSSYRCLCILLVTTLGSILANYLNYSGLSIISQREIAVSNQKISNTSFRTFWKGCPYIRFTYHCQGSAYDAFIEQWRISLVSQLQDFVKVDSRHGYNDILIVGNSHTGQLAEEIFCVFYDQIKEFKGTNLNTACLQPFPKHSICDGHGTVSSCGMYLAAATIQQSQRSAFQVFLANNHPYLFSGVEGIELLLTQMEINASKLAGVVIGGWNTAHWAGEVLSGNRSGTHYPVPSFDKECGLPWDQYFDGKVPDVVGVLKRYGFSGRVLRYMDAQTFPSHDSLDSKTLPFQESKPERNCCGPEVPGQHRCVPGYSVFSAISALH